MALCPNYLQILQLYCVKYIITNMLKNCTHTCTHAHTHTRARARREREREKKTKIRTNFEDFPNQTWKEVHINQYHTELQTELKMFINAIHYLSKW